MLAGETYALGSILTLNKAIQRWRLKAMGETTLTLRHATQDALRVPTNITIINRSSHTEEDGDSIGWIKESTQYDT